MTGLDWTLTVVIGLSVMVATAQGFFFEMFSLAGVVVGYLLAAWQYGRLAPWFMPYVKSPSAANAAGFIVIFFSVMVIAGVAGKITRWAMKEVGLRWADRLLGAAFGLVRGIVLASIAVLTIATFAPESHLLEKSELGRYLLLTARAASWVAPAELRQKFRDGIVLVRKKQVEMAAPTASAPPSSKSSGADGAHDRN